jgi:hypothetical protein
MGDNDKPGDSGPADEGAVASDAKDRTSPLERLASFRFAYGAIFIFLLAYPFTVEGVERVLIEHFSSVAAEAVRVDPADGPVPEQIHQRVGAGISDSAWVRIGEVSVSPLIVGAEGYPALFAGGIPIPLLPRDAGDLGEYLLPVRVERVDVSVPHNSLLANLILVTYAAMLVTALAIYTRRLTGREQLALEGLTRARDGLAERAQEIEAELGTVRGRLGELEPENELYAEEVETLATERQELLEKLDRVQTREQELRVQSRGAGALADERRALEELLDEATEDLATKEGEIEQLRHQVKRTSKGKSTREDDLLERRFRTLYKNLEVDEHAIADLVGFRDEGLKLRAEEAMKRLCDEPEQAIVRRKLGGLPPHLSIFELAFAGKGRIYYTRGKTRRFRILSIGAKNTQNADLDYLARLPKGT